MIVSSRVKIIRNFYPYIIHVLYYLFTGDSIFILFSRVCQIFNLTTFYSTLVRSIGFNSSKHIVKVIFCYICLS